MQVRLNFISCVHAPARVHFRNKNIVFSLYVRHKKLNKMQINREPNLWAENCVDTNMILKMSYLGNNKSDTAHIVPKTGIRFFNHLR